jgi:predicted metal-dependent phosphoesterase TrpH
MTDMLRFDLHVHTTAGSADAAFRAANLGEAARAAGLAGVLVCEHFRLWSDFELQAATEEHGITVLGGREWDTAFGHVISIGLQTQQTGFESIEELRAAADAAGAVLIAAHPFRHFFDSRAAVRRPGWEWTEDPEVAARQPLFGFVDAIEIANGHCTDRENDFAANVAAILGMPGTAGSDAHYADELGTNAIPLPSTIRNARDLAELIRDSAP